MKTFKTPKLEMAEMNFITQPEKNEKNSRRQRTKQGDPYQRGIN